MKKVIVTGATGMVGKGVLLECLDNEIVDEVLVIGRNGLAVKHPKLKELIHRDFNDFTDLKDQLIGFDACFFCLGVSSQGMKEADYKKITYNFTLSLAKTLFENKSGNNF